MSRIGKRILEIPNAVNLSANGNVMTVKGPLGQVDVLIGNNVKVDIKDSHVNINLIEGNNNSNSMIQGTVNSLLKNAIHGVSVGFSKSLKVVGVGYRVAVSGNKLNLSLGYSHPIALDIPKDLKVEAISQTEIKVSGVSKELVGSFASQIRSYREPEPYNGKGVMYTDEVIQRKVGKTAKGSKK